VPAAAQPVESGSPAAPATPAVQSERVAGTLAAPVHVVEETLEPVLPVVAGVVPPPPVSQPPLALPDVPAPAQVVEIATGAASAAGADAPPLPVPAVPPPVALPPTP
jgi:hypothetical protein